MLTIFGVHLANKVTSAEVVYELEFTKFAPSAVVDQPPNTYPVRVNVEPFGNEIPLEPEM